MERRSVAGQLAGVLCGVAVVAAILASLPFSDIGFIDDWSYVRTSEVLARTGHLVYNGWAAGIVGWQLYWGALFIKLFGDSYTVARMSTVVVAFFTVWLFEATLEGLGLRRANAVFGALTLGLSPLFLPLATSFMSDTNGVFVLVLCCWLCQQALHAKRDAMIWIWLGLAAATNMVGGTVRQPAWLAGLLIVPATAWLLRRRRGVVAAAAVAWMVEIGFILLVLHWWKTVPYAVQDKVLDLSLWRLMTLKAGLIEVAKQIVFLTLCFFYVAFPVLSSSLPRLGRLSLRVRVAVTVFALGLIGVSHFAVRSLLPWMGDVLLAVGPSVREGGLMMKPMPAMWLIAAVVSAAVVIAAPAFWFFFLRGRQAGSREAVAEVVAEGGLSFPALLVFCVPYLLGYCGLLMTRLLALKILDRYLLGLLPVAIVLLLRVYQDRAGSVANGGARMPRLSYAVLVGFAGFAVLGTHDWYAGLRAMERQEQALVQRGVDPLHISGLPEIEGMKQLTAHGYVEDPRIVLPVGAYVPNPATKLVPMSCVTWMTEYSPMTGLEYVIRQGRQPCTAGTVELTEYATWLPPFHAYLNTVKVDGNGVH